MKPFLKRLISEPHRGQVRKVINKTKIALRGNNLTELAKAYGTDKWGGHRYTLPYSSHFKPFKWKRLKLLEVGVGGFDDPEAGGESLRMWKRYFPRSRIYGIDLYKKNISGKRIKVFQGDQSDVRFLGTVVDEIGELDIIIDDGSHINEHVIKTFEFLFRYLKHGGIYVIEDTQTSYWEEFGGDSENLQKAGTMCNFFKALTDSVNHKELVKPGYCPSYYDRNIISVHFYHNMIFVYKGTNDEESNRLIDNRISDK